MTVAPLTAEYAGLDDRGDWRGKRDDMAYDDVISNLPDGRTGLAYEAFRSLIPIWPDWLRVDGHDMTSGPESGTVYHTRLEGRRFGVVVPRDPSTATTLEIRLYGITDGALSFTWAPLKTEHGSDSEDLVAVVRRVRRELPDIVAGCDLSRLGRDGEIDAWDRLYEGSRLRWKAYYEWDENWDHDHCVYCGARFSLNDPEALKAGYAIQGGSHGDDYNWICGPCVDKRRGLVAFEIEVDRDDR